MRFLACIAFCFFWAMSGRAQDTTYFFIYEAPGIDKNEAMIPTSDGGFLLVGSTTSYDESDSDAYALKLNDEHQIEWSKHLGWTFSAERALDVVEREDGNFLLLLQTNNFGAYSAYLMLVSPEGEFISGTSYGGNDWDLPQAMFRMNDGSILVCGKSYSDEGMGAQAWLLKVDQNLTDFEQLYFGNESDEWFNDLTVDDEGNVYICGAREITDSNTMTSWMLKLDPEMNIVWEKEGDTDNEEIFDVEFLADVISFHGTRIDDELGPSVLEYTYDPEGETLWTNYFPQAGETWFSEGTIVNENTFAFCGHVDIGVGAVDLMFNTLDTDGFYGQAGVIGSLEDEFARDICIAQNQHIYISGYTDGYDVGQYDVFLTYSTNDQPSGANHFELIRIEDTFITDVPLPQSKDFTVYPNPATTAVRVSGFADQAELELFDLNGKLIQTEILNPDEAFDLNGMSPGMYILRLRTKSGIIYRTRLQKM